jgi:hypothetical protein
MVLLRFAQVCLLVLLFASFCIGLPLFTQPANNLNPEPKKQTGSQRAKFAPKNGTDRLHLISLFFTQPTNKSKCKPKNKSKYKQKKPHKKTVNN